MSEQENGGSNSNGGNSPARSPWRRGGEANPADTRGPGWGQGSRFGATPQPEVPPHRGPAAGSGETGGHDAPKRRRKKPEPTHPRHTVPVVSGKVTIHRDKQGTAHINAKQEHDAWAALGFCCAQDRLWQIDILRRVATGHVSELLGAEWLEHDSLVRTAGVGRRAAAAAQRMQGVAHEMLTAYAGGVNAARALGQPPEATAMEYEIAPWTVADSLSLELYGAWALACGRWPNKLRGLGDSASATEEPIAGLWSRLDRRVARWGDVLRVPELLHALGFVTATAESLQLSAQISGPPGALGLPYAAHVRAPGLAVAGLTIPGTPNFFAGRNRSVAWAGSPIAVDDVDLVMEELDGIGNFRGRKGREKAARRQELIRVRDGEDRRVEVMETRHGPLLSHLAAQFDGAPADTRVSLAVRWGLNSLGTSMSGWLALARADNAPEAEAAGQLLSRGPVPMELLVASREGEEARLSLGQVPIRAIVNARPVRGWSDESLWKGARGVGSDASGALPDLPSEQSVGPSLSAARARLDQLLAGEMLDGPGAALVLSDVADSQARAVSEEIGRHLGAETRGGQLLQTWNGATVPDSAAASFFWILVLKFLSPALLGEGDGRRRGRLTADLLDALGPGAAVSQARPELIREAATEAEGFLAQKAGSNWAWGGICQVDRKHLLAGQELFATAGLPERTKMGSPGAIFRVGLANSEAGIRIVSEPSARLICDLGTSHAALVLAGGSSGVFTSVHFLDQAGPFDQGRLTSFPVDGDVDGELSELLP